MAQQWSLSASPDCLLTTYTGPSCKTALGDAVYVQDGAVIGQAPALPVVVIEI